MSVARTYQSPVFGRLNVETYRSAQEMAEDLEHRTVTDSSFKRDPYQDRRFVGASRDETLRMLRDGYQPTVDALKDKIKVNATGKRFKTFNDVVGFQPIIPNVIMGLPKAMVNSSMTPIKTKVIDVYYDMTVACHVDSKDLIKAGQKMLGVILEMESQGYRFNLYVTQNYGDSKGCDMVCVKIKSAEQPFDLKRMSFPVSHTAFFRGVGFDWYSKFPLGKFRDGYGTAIAYRKSMTDINQEVKRLFGKNAVYFTAKELVSKKDNADKYLKGVLTNDK